MPAAIFSKNQRRLIIFFQAANVHFFKYSIIKYSSNNLFRRQEVGKVQTKKQQGRKFSLSSLQNIFQKKKKIKGILAGRVLQIVFLAPVNIGTLPTKTVKSKFQMNFWSRILSSPILGLMSQY